MRTIISFTGGLDSTLLLYKLLTETDDEIYAFTLDCRYCVETTLDHKQYMEQICAMKIAHWMNENIRPFKYSIIERPNGFTYEALPMIEALYFAIPYLNENLYDRFVFAFSAEDTGVFGMQVQNAMKYRFEQYATRGTLEFPLQEWNYGRAHLLTMIPENLLFLTSDCNRLGPNHERCGHCGKCKSRKEDLERLKQGLTPEECLKLRLERKNKNKGYRDSNGIMRSWADEAINMVGVAIPTEDPIHKEYKHIFNNNYDGGIHEPKE